MARFLLDHAETVRGLRVLDIGSGCGIAAIAAARAGAALVHASDIDPVACQAIAANAGANDVRLEIRAEDPIGASGHWDVILAADMWYERFLAMRLGGWLRQQAGSGTRVLLADLGRAYFPKAGMIELARFDIPSSTLLERSASTTASVWQMRAHVRQ